MDWQAEDGTVHENCAVFHKVKEELGGLSNMAGGYRLLVNGAEVRSSEALYQACRYPNQPEWQHEIITQASPMAAKMVSRKAGRRKSSRPDWDEINVEVMRWVVRVKLAQHFVALRAIFHSTGDRAIVERSHRDRFWGAVEAEDGRLHGRNVLGQMLMELRECVRTGNREELEIVAAPEIADFQLLGRPVEIVRGRG